MLVYQRVSDGKQASPWVQPYLPGSILIGVGIRVGGNYVHENDISIGYTLW